MADYEINWLPIETAPRNGVPIVIACSGSDFACALMGVGYWCDENELWLVDGREYGESKGNWGWCPLPPFPPEEGTQAGEVWRAQVSARRNEGHAAAKAVVEKDEAEFEEIMKAIELGTKWNKNKGMSEPAKDEIVLLRLAGEAIRQVLIKPPYCMEGTGCELPPCGCSQEAGKAVLAAIRAAGWDVVPQTEQDTLRAENARLRDALEYAEAAAKGMASSIRTTLEVKP